MQKIHGVAEVFLYLLLVSRQTSDTNRAIKTEVRSTEVFIARFVTEPRGARDKQNPDVLRQNAFNIIIIFLETSTNIEVCVAQLVKRYARAPDARVRAAAFPFYN